MKKKKKYIDSVQIDTGNGIIRVKIDPDDWECETEDELHALIETSYDNVAHFLEENAPDWKFVWTNKLSKSEVEKLFCNHYDDGLFKDL